MKIHKLTSTDAFIAIDLPDVPGYGVTRTAKKILQDGAKLLSRSTTYAFASFGIQRSGASAGINALDDGRDDAVAAFVGEVEPMVVDGRWVTDPSTGLTEDDLASLRGVDPRPEDVRADANRLLVAGAVTAAAALRDGGLGGARCALVGGGWLRDQVAAALADAGAELVDGGTDAEVDVLFLAGKTGMLDHEAVPEIQANLVVPLSAAPVTARAHADLIKAEIVHVPDFLSTAAPLLAAFDPDGGDPVARVRDAVEPLAVTGTGLWLAAAVRAEEFLLTWQDELPDFRPLA